MNPYFVLIYKINENKKKIHEISPKCNSIRISDYFESSGIKLRSTKVRKYKLNFIIKQNKFRHFTFSS